MSSILGKSRISIKDWPRTTRFFNYMFYFKRFDKERLNLGEVGSHLSILPFLILLTEHYIVLNFLLPGCTQD